MAAKRANKTQAHKRATAQRQHAARTLGITLLSAGAATIGIGAAAALWLLRRQPNPAEHAAPDLAPGAPEPGTTRAPEAFRPDPTAIPTAGERESLRPATGHAPGFAADRGTTVQ